MMADDRFDLELFCQHCGQYLTSLAGIDRPVLDAARDKLRQEAQRHANTVGRGIEVTYCITLKRTTVIEPRPSLCWAIKR